MYSVPVLQIRSIQSYIYASLSDKSLQLKLAAHLSSSLVAPDLLRCVCRSPEIHLWAFQVLVFKMTVEKGGGEFVMLNLGPASFWHPFTHVFLASFSAKCITCPGPGLQHSSNWRFCRGTPLMGEINGRKYGSKTTSPVEALWEQGFWFWDSGNSVAPQSHQSIGHGHTPFTMTFTTWGSLEFQVGTKKLTKDLSSVRQQHQCGTVHSVEIELKLKYEVRSSNDL